MLSILIVETKPAVIDALNKYFEDQFKAKVYIVPNLDEAKAFLQENISKGIPNLVVVRSILDEIETARGILNFVYELDNGPPVISLGNVEFSGLKFDCLPDRFKISELSKVATKLLNVSKKDLEEIHRPPYTGISIKNFYDLGECLCDVFIRISKKNCEDQYVKRLHKGDNFDRATLQKYEQMGLKEFFVKSEDLNMVLTAFEQKALSQLDKKFSPDELVKVGSSQFEIGQDLLLKLGISDFTMKIVDTNIKAMSGAIMSGPPGANSFADLMKSILSNKSGYNYKHSFLIAFLCSSIIPKMEWGKNDQLKSNVEKMIYVAFLHDVLLEDEKLVRIQSQAQLEAAGLDEKQKEIVEYHANKVSNLAQSMSRTPAGVDIILKQHHGTTNGVGFSTGHSSSLSGLAILFIVIEHFTHMLLDYQNLKLGPKAILTKMTAEFSLPSYRKVVEAMSEMMKH